MVSAVEIESLSLKQEQLFRKPLQLSGVLSDTHKSLPLTPSIGQEFPRASIQELLTAPNSNALLRDLAITVSQRGVVFFRNQQSLTIAQQKELAQRLGELNGKPESSKLHIHPLHNSEREHGTDDDEVSVISSEEAKKYLQNSMARRYGLEKKKSLAPQWHTDYSLIP
jgi:alpha-ketoglutarate-dependent taurine dioxygenase